LFSEAAIQARVADLLERNRGEPAPGSVAVDGERVAYDLWQVDARTDRQRAEDTARGWPRGHVLVVVPGHGQTARGPRKLIATAALLSRSGLAWSVDPTPARGGDCTEARAIAAVVRQRMADRFPALDDEPQRWPVQASLVGYSHGGAEALRAAACDPGLFPQFLGLCPTGLLARRPLELLASFGLESLRILGSALRRGDWSCLGDALRLGLNAFALGLFQDLVRSRSLRRLVEDVGWATARVTGRPFAYPGQVVVLFGREDTVIRWRDLFPHCRQPEEIGTHRATFQLAHFPQAHQVEVQVLTGTHIGPEVDAPRWLVRGLALLGQGEGGERRS
jgi:hypothetical protein